MYGGGSNNISRNGENRLSFWPLESKGKFKFFTLHGTSNILFIEYIDISYVFLIVLFIMVDFCINQMIWKQKFGFEECSVALSGYGKSII